MLVIEEITAQVPQGRNAGDILSLCEVLEKKYYIKNVEKNSCQNLGKLL